MVTPVNLKTLVRGQILLPDTIYWTDSGRDRYVYFADAMLANMHASVLGINCDVLIQSQLYGVHNRTHLVVPSATNLPLGVHQNALHLAATFDGQEVIAKNVTIHVADKDTPVNKRLLVIGDSNTEAALALNRLTQTAAADPTSTLTLVGTRGTAPNLHEGVSGKTISWFASDPASPFVLGGVFDFGAYLAANAVTLGAGDWVAIALGTNDFSSAYENVLESRISGRLTDLSGMVANITAAVPGIRVMLCGVMPGSANQDDFGLNYGSGLSRDRATSNFRRWNRSLIGTFDNDAHRQNGVYVAPTHVVIDPSADFAANALHPSASGMNRVGDVIWQMIKAL